MRRNLIITLVVFLLMVQFSYALTNESITAEKGLDNSRIFISEMISRNISVHRVNETFQEALQIYSAQKALEEKQGSAVYTTVIKDTENIRAIYLSAIKAQDELTVFREYINEINDSIDLSQATQSINAVEISFSEERFEDTLRLINEAYSKVSELSAQQTTIKLFYDATSRSIKSFFVNNWKRLSLIGVILVFVLIISWKTLKKIKIRREINYLISQKQALNSLIKKLQNDYFKVKKISETEYTVKTEKFKEMIRDIDRQLPLLNETLFKLEKQNTIKNIQNSKLNKKDGKV
jgi:hypothetical protein